MDTFERRLGAALMAQTKPLAELIREWDRNGDGDINTIELRQCVRNSLGVKADNREIDAWMVKVDADGSGVLELPEVKAALKSLKDAVLADKAAVRRLREEAESADERRRGPVTIPGPSRPVVLSLSEPLGDLCLTCQCEVQWTASSPARRQ